MPFLANWVPGSLLYIFVSSIWRIETGLLSLEGDGCISAYWLFLLALDCTSSFLRKVYLVWKDSSISLPVPPRPKANIILKLYFLYHSKEISEWLHGFLPSFIDRKTEVQGYKTSDKTGSATKISLVLPALKSRLILHDVSLQLILLNLSFLFYKVCVWGNNTLL